MHTYFIRIHYLKINYPDVVEYCLAKGLEKYSLGNFFLSVNQLIISLLIYPNLASLELTNFHSICIPPN